MPANNKTRTFVHTPQRSKHQTSKANQSEYVLIQKCRPYLLGNKLSQHKVLNVHAVHKFFLNKYMCFTQQHIKSLRSHVIHTVATRFEVEPAKLLCFCNDSRCSSKATRINVVYKRNTWEPEAPRTTKIQKNN